MRSAREDDLAVVPLGRASISSICRSRQIQHATFERERELLELPDVKARVYGRQHEQRRLAEAWLPDYPGGANEPVWVGETAQSFQVFQYCHMALGW